MVSPHEIAALKIQVAEDRCEALREQIRSLSNRAYSSPGCMRLIKFAAEATHAISELLEAERNLPDRELLTEKEFEHRVHRATKLIPVLHFLLSYVEGSGLETTPAPLVAQLRRFAQKVMPDSEVIVRSGPYLNYSIDEIATKIRTFFEETPLKKCSESLQRFLFVITIPRVESDEILLHCILSHELGHGLYELHKLASAILQTVRINQESVRRIVQEITNVGSNQKIEAPPPLAEVALRESVTRGVISTSTNWVRELSSDAFGIYLFGPAYFFSFIYFFLAFVSLDRASDSHPPPRLRLKLMANLLDTIYPETAFDQTIRPFVQYWKSVSSKDIDCPMPIASIALESIDKPDVLEKIGAATNSALASLPTYDAKRYVKDVRDLSPLLVNLVPPGETGVLEHSKPTDIATILNVGWHVYLSSFDSFRKNLPTAESSSAHLARRKLQQLLLKAFEIAEIKLSWEEVRDDSRLREDKKTTQ